MNVVRPVLRNVLALFCLAMGLVQLAWVSWLYGNSLHMGSPLRLHSDGMIRSVSDSAIRGHIDYMHKVGLLGFDLLGYSMWLHFICGVLLTGLSAVLFVAARGSKYSKAAH